jgi:hypothetical protein
MGLELRVESARPLGDVLARLAADGAPSTIVMVDGALVMPNVPPPATWTDVRLKTPAGTLALKRQGNAVSVVAFGNADEATQRMQERVADALRG